MSNQNYFAKMLTDGTKVCVRDCNDSGRFDDGDQIIKIAPNGKVDLTFGKKMAAYGWKNRM